MESLRAAVSALRVANTLRSNGIYELKNRTARCDRLRKQYGT